ncbi:MULTISPECIES: CDP-alcohol phosphatidyltransferase family protein [unclassified Paenibacillus]|uniref:CDP-alcohol phosphatidyltransferase family protein n=1 Tax=unclassified Paenibacillus TaxID=185978 RepID=UPI0009DFC461|nr:CDP-alcohol phosphatidyltransferase family protein [Paenibacillus sp. FSL R5-0345]
MARKYNQVTNLGKLLDPLADKLPISAALILLVSQQMLYAWVALVIVAREVITNIPINQILIYISLVITIYSGFNYIRNNYRFLKLEA